MTEIVEVDRPPWEETLTELANGRAARVTIPRSKDLRRQQVVNAFQDAFHLIGGTPRLAGPCSSLQQTQGLPAAADAVTHFNVLWWAADHLFCNETPVSTD